MGAERRALGNGDADELEHQEHEPQPHSRGTRDDYDRYGGSHTSVGWLRRGSLTADMPTTTGQPTAPPFDATPAPGPRH
jgi:hypothetical protein